MIKKCFGYISIAIMVSLLLTACGGKSGYDEGYEAGLKAAQEASETDDTDETDNSYSDEMESDDENELFGEIGSAKDWSDADQNYETQDYSYDTSDGYFAYRQVVSDPQTGYPVAEVLVPQGWVAACEVNWDVYDVAFPALAHVAVYKEDGTAQMDYYTTQQYMMNSKEVAGYSEQSPEGVDYELHATRLDYQRADEYAEGIISGNLSSEYSILSDVPNNDEEFGQVEQWYHDYCISQAQISQQALGSAMQYDLLWDEVTQARKYFSYINQQTNAQSYGEISTLVLGTQSAITTPGTVHIGNIVDYTTVWMPVFIQVYTAYDEDSYNNNYDEYEMISDSITIRAEFTSAMKQKGLQLADQVFTYIAQKNGGSSGTSLDTQSEIEETYDTIDRTFEMWDDVIKEQNEYALEDGSTIKVPTKYDAVYQSGDELYFGTDGGAPDGWNKLYETY